MKDTFISPLSDFAFAQIFGSQQNIGNTRAFLTALLDIPADDYDKLTVENPTLERSSQEDKKSIVDLKLRTKSGRIIHIEIQVKKESGFQSRILYYAARSVGDQLRWGKKYQELNQVISIVICDHELLENESSYINVFKLQNERNNAFTDLLKVIILELPKLPEAEKSKLWPARSAPA